MKFKALLNLSFLLILLLGMLAPIPPGKAAVADDCQARLNDDPTEYTLLQEAINASSDPADIVKVAGTCGSVSIVDKSLTLEGGYEVDNWTTPDPAANVTTIDALGITYGVYIYSTGAPTTPTLRGLHITNGANVFYGAGVHADNAAPTIENCQIYANNADTAGGGIYLANAPGAQLLNNEIRNNNAPSGAGGQITSGSDQVVVTGNLFRENVAQTGSGGALEISGVQQVTLSDNVLHWNGAMQYGGGLMLWGVTDSTISANTFDSNSAAVVGGGMALRDSDGNTISGNTFLANEVTGPGVQVSGGAIRLQESDNNTIEANTFTGNLTPNLVSNGYGGAIDVYLSQGSLIRNNTFSENRASTGHGVRFAESPGGTLSGNTFTLNGDATYPYSSTTVQVTESDAVTLTGNVVEQSQDDYAAFYLVSSDDLVVTHNELHHNRGRGIIASFLNNPTIEDNDIYENAGGIAINSSSNITLQRNTIVHNGLDSGDGAGLKLLWVGSGTAANNWIADNYTNSGNGPGIYIEDSIFDLVHNTIGHNTGGGGQGIYVYSNPSRLRTPEVVDSTITVANSILVAQEVGLQVTPGTTTSLGDTLWGTGDSGNLQDIVNDGGTINRSGTDWHLDPAFVDPEHGDLHLTAASEAIDRASPTAITDDIDGEARPNEGAADLGADEYYPPEPITGLAASNSSPTALGEGTYFTATVATGEPWDYHWIFSADADAHGPQVSYLYTLPGVYEATVTAMDETNVLTATTTVTVYEALAVAPGEVQTSADGMLDFELPASAGEGLTIQYTPQNAPTQPPGSFEFAGLVFELQAFDGGGTPVSTPDEPLTLTVHHDESALPAGTDEADLQLYRYDEGLGEWLALTVLARSPAQDTLTVLLDHFSEFALGVVAPQVEEYKVFAPVVRR
jgi:parallel beta-helix repeat protein